MKFDKSFYSVVQQIRPFLSKGLCADQYWDKIRSIASQFPTVSQAMLEIRLADQVPQIDFGILIVKDWGEMGLLLEHCEKNPSFLKVSPDFWEPILKICRQSTDGDGLLSQNLQNIWVAFDTEGKQTATIPYVYFVTGPLPYHGEIVASISRQILHQYGSGPTELQYLKLLELIEWLPASVKMEAFGRFERGQNEVLRLAIRPFYHLDSLDSFLKHISNFKVLEDHHQLIAALMRSSDCCQLLVDISDRLIPRIGLEFWLNRKHNGTKSTDMLQLLVDQGYCGLQRRRELLDWISEPGSTEIHRWINHVKFTLEEGTPSPLHPKVYLAFSSSKSGG